MVRSDPKMKSEKLPMLFIVFFEILLNGFFKYPQTFGKIISILDGKKRLTCGAFFLYSAPENVSTCIRAIHKRNPTPEKAISELRKPLRASDNATSKMYIEPKMCAFRMHL